MGGRCYQGGIPLTDACMQPLSPPTLHLLKLLDTCMRWPQKESAVVVSSQHTHTHTYTHEIADKSPQTAIQRYHDNGCSHDLMKSLTIITNE